MLPTLAPFQPRCGIYDTLQAQPSQARDSSKIKMAHYGGFKPRKFRYDLCTALVHSGSLRDDLVVGKSNNFNVWQGDGPGVVHRSALFQRLFDEIYSMDYDTAGWMSKYVLLYCQSKTPHTNTEPTTIVEAVDM